MLLDNYSDSVIVVVVVVLLPTSLQRQPVGTEGRARASCSDGEEDNHDDHND